MSSFYLTKQTFSSSVDLFLFDRQARGRTTGTIDYYKEELIMFFSWIEKEGLSDVELIPSDTIKKFFIDLSKRRNKGGVHCTFRVIRAFFNWYNSEYEPQWKNPIKKVKISLGQVKPLPEYPLEDIKKMIDVCEGRHKLRDIAILKCLLDTGCRGTEFISLNYEDINLTTGSVLIKHGKGDKSRIVWLGAKGRKALSDYLATRKVLTATSPLWLNDERERLKFYGLREVVVRVCERANVENKGLHAFRRTFGITLYRKGIDILSISRLLGHGSIEVTKRYLNISNEDLREAHNRASPADSLE